MAEILHGSPYPTPRSEQLADYHLDHAVDRYLAVLGIGSPTRVPAA
jgi:hypothetical protein